MTGNETTPKYQVPKDASVRARIARFDFQILEASLWDARMMPVATLLFMRGDDETSRWDKNWQFTHATWQFMHADCARLNASWQVFLGAG